MKTKYVCRALISLYINFHNNRTMWSTKLHVKFRRWGGEEKEPLNGMVFINQNNKTVIANGIKNWLFAG